MTAAKVSSELVTLRPVSRSDGETESLWFPLDHPYVERCWTSVVGPTGIALLRRAAVLFSTTTDPTIDLPETALDLGITGSDAIRRMRRTLSRLERLGFVDRPTADEVHIFVDVPALPNRELRRSTLALRADHARLVRERRTDAVILDGSVR